MTGYNIQLYTESPKKKYVSKNSFKTTVSENSIVTSSDKYNQSKFIRKCIIIFSWIINFPYGKNEDKKKNV